MFRPSPRLLASSLFLLAALVLGSAACVPDLSVSGKDGCLTDSDCLVGLRCEGARAGVQGVCTLGAASNNAAVACDPVDRDGDGAFAGEGCTPLDCDDADPTSAPGLAETCDLTDNDCDGFIDEGVLSACGTCAPLTEEVCDGRDNDCDGVIDDDVTNRCGACGPEPDEICDGLDNDCDGEIDEIEGCACDAEGETRACPRSACAEGVQRCEGGRWGACEGDAAPCPDTVEVCDLLDNNGDGRFDEGFPAQTDKDHCGGCGMSCGTFQSEPAACVAFTCQTTCLPGWHDIDGDPANGCEYPCLPTGTIDICEDGLDNECDGTIDTRCAKQVLGGRYAFFVIYGVSEERRPTHSLRGVLDFTDPAQGEATIGEVTLYPSGSRAPEARAGISRRRVTFDADHRVELAPADGSTDTVGSIFRGYASSDPGRSILLLGEFNADGGALGTLAIAVRLPDADITAPSGPLRGPLTGVQLLPNALLGEGSTPATSLLTLSLDAAPGDLRGKLLAQTTPAASRTFTDAQAPRLNADAARGGAFSATVEGGGLALLWEGQLGLQSELAIAHITPAERSSVAPGLLALAPRRADGNLETLTGRWFLAGLHVQPPATPEEPLRYFSTRRTLTVEPDPQDPGARRLLDDDDATLWATVRTAPDITGRSLLITPTASGESAPASLRGYATPSGLGMLLWEQGSSPYTVARPSLFFAIRLP